MTKPFKDKLKNAGELISRAIVDAGRQAKDSEVIDKISKGAKDGLVFVSKGVKDGTEKLSNSAKSGADAIKNALAEHKKQDAQDVIESKEQEDNKERKVSLDEQLHDAVNKYNAAYAEFENNGSTILRQRERSVDLLV